MTSSTEKKNWLDDLKKFSKPSVITMLFLGISAGIPILLIFSSLSLWLREAGISRSTVTFFSWAGLGYSFKFVWAPLVDKLPLPVLTKLMGRRRSWILFAQFTIIISITGMALTDPTAGTSSLSLMAFFALLLGFSSATQDIVIDAYRIESDSADMQALLSSTYIAGYRIGMLIAGAGPLFIAEWFGSTNDHYQYSAWRWAYIIMALTMTIGVLATFLIPEPKATASKSSTYTNNDYSRFLLFFVIVATCFAMTFFFSADLAKQVKQELAEFLGKGLGGLLTEALRLTAGIFSAFIASKIVLATKLISPGMVEETYVEPVKDFFSRYGKSVALLFLALIGFYRVSDIVLGVIANVFYQDMGFSKSEIGTVVKSFGLFMTLAGGFLGGLLTIRYGVIRMLLWGAILSAVTNLLFMLMAGMGHNMPMLYLVISADNLAGGMASAAFIAFLSSLTNVSFTAVQYAIFSSLMTLFPKVLGGYSGSMVDAMGYSGFFGLTAVLGIPVIALVIIAGKKLEIHQESN